MKITWLGHSGFRIEIAGQVLLVDPWLVGNPVFPEDRRAEAIAGATHILVTHGHFDHIADAVAIARELSIPCVGVYDLMSWWEEKEGIATIGFNKGGTVALGEVRVTM
ncbi:MBL fold metallo-hydrolase, partial [Rhodovulum sp.]|uniref:MBL fold metallo-hydrolase n=1 Tax=Rhodovulum sp. TaxID=34009 RepID=UPI00184310CA